MCGIVGVVSVKKQLDRAWLALARDTMIHRGPDDMGEWWSNTGQVGFAQRRLAIIDLSPLGHQPMVQEQLGLTITFNGEIYNFREIQTLLKMDGYTFQSMSDTEVLLAAYHRWGVDCLEHLNGMFSFAIYDSKHKQIFFARDRAGEKPFFYYHADKTLYFASELKALLANAQLPRRINREALDCYLGIGYVPGDRCILDGYRKLAPAHAMTFDLISGATKIWRYWQVPEAPRDSVTAAVYENQLLKQLEELLATAVQKQMVADVPVGVLLSGGVDSSLITAMAVRSSNKLRTFTVGFPGYGSMDETSHARLIADYFKTDHTELAVDDINPELLYQLARQYDEPIVDSSMLPTFLVSRLVRQHCTVALGGDGGDELFGGYGHYSRLLWMKEKLGRIPYCLRSLLGRSAEAFMPLGYKGRNWLQALGSDLDRSLPLIASYFDRKTRLRLIPGAVHIESTAEQILTGQMPTSSNLLDRATRQDFNNYLAEDILVKVDRASMLNSLEIRAPFLDVDLIDFAFGKVPHEYKATSLDRKILLKRLTAKVLPPGFDRQRKQGFSIPLANWLKAGPFRKLFEQVLLDKQCVFDQTVVQKLFLDHDRGCNNSERLFSLLMLELWRKTYAIEF